jgi:hypothetical protein
LSFETSSDAFESGRTDTAHELADRLASAEPGYLEGALANPALDEPLARILLRNRGATRSILLRLSEEPRFRRSYGIRAALVMHPNTPRAVALNLTHHLYWRDLAHVADNHRVPPSVRRTAVRLLEDRLEDLSLGEQLWLARTAGRSVVQALRHTRTESVVGALLKNASLVEEDLLLMSHDTETPSGVLTRIARDPKWSMRYPIRLALVNNRRTPIGAALGLLTGLLSHDLRELATGGHRPAALRQAAGRVLHGRGARRRVRERDEPATYELE